VEKSQDMVMPGDSRESPGTFPHASSDPADLARQHTLELARTRALADLASARSPAHRQMLEAAVQALDEQLRHLATRRMS
jgi:hypothetical protein